MAMIVEKRRELIRRACLKMWHLLPVSQIICGCVDDDLVCETCLLYAKDIEQHGVAFAELQAWTRERISAVVEDHTRRNPETPHFLADGPLTFNGVAK
jgi:hypothetical protein